MAARRQARSKKQDGAATFTSADSKARTIPQHPQPDGYEAAAVLVPIEELLRWADNPRINRQSVRKAMRSIRTYGFGAPMLARIDTKELIAGDTRIQAAYMLRKRGVQGLDKLPVRFMTLDALKSMGLAIADNRIAEDSEWNDAKRDALMRRLEEADEDLVATGLDDDEIETALGFEDDLEEDAGAGEDEEGKITETYQVIIDCVDEAQQAELLERLQGEGLKVKALLS